MKYSINDIFSKCDQIHRKLRIWSHLLEEILNGKLHFLCSVSYDLVKKTERKKEREINKRKEKIKTEKTKIKNKKRNKKSKQEKKNQKKKLKKIKKRKKKVLG